ncbi:MAG: RNase adapter RapZ [Gammaproteobacteria bacterium]|nr:RNase adapter RapZ [Gammaproteobacteria bacterium]MDH5801541.1 RNase adapter RapZ [Gammaproteobacteria bacterium]
MKLIVISGVSGSGKSTGLNLLEDLGYYCIDNLPVGLLPAFSEQMQAAVPNTVEHIAVGIDARNLHKELHRFPYILDQIKNKGISCDVLFLDADDDILLKRFSETRRKHPLTANKVPLLEAIKIERELLEPISSRADLYIDTSRSNVHQLRELIRERLNGNEFASLSLLFESFGFKHGVPADADFVFDARCLPNPHWEPRLRQKTGLDDEVVTFLETHQDVDKMYRDIKNFLDHWIPKFEADNRSYMTIAIGCTGGQHRSVFLAQKLGEHYKTQRDNVLMRHRDLP